VRRGEDAPRRDRRRRLIGRQPPVVAGAVPAGATGACDTIVATVCMGLGASMGQFLLCAGAKDKRYALPHARIMMHQPSGGFRGQAADIAIQAEQLLYVKQLMAERIAFHTGQTVDQVLADSERDRWITAEQAKDYGIIDNVIVKRGEML
jgi:ATP-dependent Clp protease protease subunit